VLQARHERGRNSGLARQIALTQATLDANRPEREAEMKVIHLHQDGPGRSPGTYLEISATTAQGTRACQAATAVALTRRRVAISSSTSAEAKRPSGPRGEMSVKGDS
jgi:hypothetical protein